jgi:hypothetical protein
MTVFWDAMLCSLVGRNQTAWSDIPVSHFTVLAPMAMLNGRFDIKILMNFYIVSIGKRPFGVSILYMGWDKHYGYQLYQSDPSGNYGGWKATCIGNNSAVSTFSSENKLIIMFYERVAYPKKPAEMRILKWFVT